jgi:glutamate-ammonia-ligase adenylyltransferase
MWLAGVPIPLALREEADQVYAVLFAALEASEQSTLTTILASSPELAVQLSRALLGSQYLLESCCRHPELLFHWLLTDIPYAPLSAARIVDVVELSCGDCTTPEALDKALRVLRRRLMVGIIWRDLNRLSDFSEVCQSMTAMAEACIQQALDFHYQLLSEKHGKPIGQVSQQPQPLVVLGMGKLGGSELNVSSDIDLIFAFPESGQTDHASRPLDNQPFFIRLGQRLIKSLNEVTADGFVFRVDMRLRPYGQSGALASSFTALENYYATQGRDWERFAAIKARVVACVNVADAEESLALRHLAVDQLEHILQPFVYRRYTDFSVIESLRQLKSMIVQEVRRKGMDGNVKLGAGGIRELEFIAQSFQLVRGGRESYLQERHWLAVMAQLRSAEVFEAGVADSLSSAYVFLRNTEHAIQAYQDQQTQQLPSAPRVQAVLAWVMGFDDWNMFADVLESHRQCVSEQFQHVIAAPEEDASQPTVSGDCLSLWQRGSVEQEESILWLGFLSAEGCEQPEALVQQLERLRESWAVKRLSANARESLDVLMPQLMTVALDLEQPDTTLLRMLAWLEKIVGRSSYITLLLENPTVLRHLAMLFQGSVWIADLLGQMPSLLDELLDADSLYTLPSKAELQNELRVRLLRVEPDDVEATMEVLRYFKLAHSLRVAASDLAGCLPLMNVSDYLTWIAEVVLEQVLSLAWQQLSLRHGVPEGLICVTQSAGVCDPIPGFLVVAYGKLGGVELSYSSDLDLVFIYKADPHMMTNGDKAIDAQTFYTRLGQKVIHILNTRSLSGPLYEVDMRLRPSGNSGLLASTLSAFSRYQLSEAWTWEHQALVRARPIVGDSQLMQDFADLRRQVLGQARGLRGLQVEVIEMRQKMRDHLGSSGGGQRKKDKNTDKKPLFHLKQDAGGIVDIEFMVQYAVLAWASQQPNIAEYTDNIRILQQMQTSGFMDADKVSLLIETYKAYRELTHRLALQQASSLVVEDQFPTYALPIKRQQVRELWRQLLCSDDHNSA